MQGIQWWTVRVPTKLVNDTNLPIAARALYMVILDQANPETGECRLPATKLAQLAGCRSNETVMAYVEQLSEAGWLRVSRRKGRSPHIRVSVAATEGAAVAIPGYLLYSPQLRPADRCLYAVLFMRRKRRNDTVQATVPDLLDATGIGSPSTVRGAIARLIHAGWLWVPEGAKAGGRTYRPLDPHLGQRETALGQLRARLKRLQFVGEALLQAMLTEAVAVTEFQPGARLSEITNPLTGEPLEFDRWYPGPKVAIEYNGRQHYQTTELFPDPKELLRQQARDLIKDALARRNRITLITFDEPELTFAHIAAKLSGVLPLRTLRHEDPLVRYLNRESVKHVRRYSRWLAERDTAT